MKPPSFGGGNIVESHTGKTSMCMDPTWGNAGWCGFTCGDMVDPCGLDVDAKWYFVIGLT